VTGLIVEFYKKIGIAVTEFNVTEEFKLCTSP